MTTPIVGILLGLAAASCQSLSYLVTRSFVTTFSRHPVYLFGISHVIMAMASVVLLPLAYHGDVPSFSRYGLPLLIGAAAYIWGQSALFMAIRSADASRVSPLLGAKIVVLALLSMLLVDQQFSPLQWGAIILTLGAAALLMRIGTTVPIASLLWVLTAIVGYSVSDIYTRMAIGSFTAQGLSVFRSTIIVISVTYTIVGVFAGTVLLMLRNNARLPDFARHGALFALVWFSAMLLLFSSFSLIGVVFGNIVQSSRGIISILLGWMIARVGFEHLEERSAAGVAMRRIGAALLMSVAISLFYLAN